MSDPELEGARPRRRERARQRRRGQTVAVAIGVAALVVAVTVMAWSGRQDTREAAAPLPSPSSSPSPSPSPSPEQTAEPEPSAPPAASVPPPAVDIPESCTRIQPLANEALGHAQEGTRQFRDHARALEEYRDGVLALDAARETWRRTTADGLAAATRFDTANAEFLGEVADCLGSGVQLGVQPPACAQAQDLVVNAVAAASESLGQLRGNAQATDALAAGEIDRETARAAWERTRAEGLAAADRFDAVLTEYRSVAEACLAGGPPT